jgi:hypothetical protein
VPEQAATKCIAAVLVLSSSATPCRRPAVGERAVTRANYARRPRHERARRMYPALSGQAGQAEMAVGQANSARPVGWSRLVTVWRFFDFLFFIIFQKIGINFKNL